MDIVFHPGQNGTDPWVEFYPYTPSATAGYAFMGIFGLSTLTHIVLMFPFRAAYFIPLVLGGICMMILPIHKRGKDIRANDERNQARHSATTAEHGHTSLDSRSNHGPCRRCSFYAHHLLWQLPSTWSSVALSAPSAPNIFQACALNGLPLSSS